jgi:FkbM family methyltransferase
MRLFAYDAYASLTRVLDRDGALVLVDVGANEGQTARRMLEEFPRARVFAFEPSPETFPRLEARAKEDPRITPLALACGPTSGWVDFHMTQNHWCSSVLAPSALGKRYYGEWYEEKGVVRVPMVTLDEWASRAGVATVDVLKVDAQGYDLQVLRGARGLLAGGVKAVNCECQFASEYEGCATFSEVDRFLVEQGYCLHQLHEVWSKGSEEQTSYCDALWLRADVLAQLRARPDLPDLSPRGRVGRALAQAKARGRRVAALYGAGQHTQRLAENLGGFALPIAAIIDDDPRRHGTVLGGCEVVSRERALAKGVDAIVLSSDAHEAAMWVATRALRERGIEVMALYGRHAHPDGARADAGPNESREAPRGAA